MIDPGISTSREEKPFDVLILYSGGKDSRVLLELAKIQNLNPFCLIIDYGQKHCEEITVAKTVLNKEKVNYVIARVTLPDIVKSALTTKDSGIYNNVHWAHVPGRNTIFTGLAASIAESLGISEIWIGSNMSDYLNRFPDCFQSWISKMDEVTRSGGSFPISFKAPLLGLTSEDCLRFLQRRNISEDNYFSGYGNITEESTSDSI